MSLKGPTESSGSDEISTHGKGVESGWFSLDLYFIGKGYVLDVLKAKFIQ